MIKFMKFFVSIFLIMLLGFAFGLYLPWWTIAVASFIVAVFIYQPPLLSFLTGFSAILILWLLLILKINSSNEEILASRISLVMGFGDSAFMLVLITCIAGAVTGGLGALTGSLLRKARG